ncbi:hypothetical protein GE09DRAFT_1162413 [Coniochaeta sp. 2T2.1]|nr:hypothetical protein GE09DRAFT_1162413 [Coniochaeta sp. 2T2.1]
MWILVEVEAFTGHQPYFRQIAVFRYLSQLSQDLKSLPPTILNQGPDRGWTLPTKRELWEVFKCCPESMFREVASTQRSAQVERRVTGLGIAPLVDRVNAHARATFPSAAISFPFSNTVGRTPSPPPRPRPTAPTKQPARRPARDGGSGRPASNPPAFTGHVGKKLQFNKRELERRVAGLERMESDTLDGSTAANTPPPLPRSTTSRQLGRSTTPHNRSARSRLQEGLTGGINKKRKAPPRGAHELLARRLKKMVIRDKLSLSPSADIISSHGSFHTLRVDNPGDKLSLPLSAVLLTSPDPESERWPYMAAGGVIEGVQSQSNGLRRLSQAQRLRGGRWRRTAAGPDAQVSYASRDMETASSTRLMEERAGPTAPRWMHESRWTRKITPNGIR